MVSDVNEPGFETQHTQGQNTQRVTDASRGETMIRGGINDIVRRWWSYLLAMQNSHYQWYNRRRFQLFKPQRISVTTMPFQSIKTFG
jgi:hypothetical protein